MPEESNDQELAKARVFFERARSFASKGNVEYAIDMYLEGLQHAPDALEEGHVPLAELGLTRQTKGGKKPSMVEKMKRLRGKTPLEQMINAEYLLVRDPEHIPYAEAMLKAAVSGGYKRVAGWVANVIFQKNNSLDRPSFQTYVLLKDSYAAIGDYDKALAACQRAVKLRPDDGALMESYKNLSAELTMAKGRYSTEGDFRQSIKNREAQEKLHAQGVVVKTENYRQSAVDEARRKLAANPELPMNIFNLADALSDIGTDEAENSAIELLESTYSKRSDFSFKQRAGVIRMKQLRRKLRKAKSILEADKNNEKAKAALQQINQQLNATELEHYRLSMENYPTDLSAKYEYGIRLLRNKKYNEAIPLFQEAQKDPRRKIASMDKIGLCFFKKGWYSDAIDVFTQALEAHQSKEDSIGKDLRYNLARAYEEKGDTSGALDVYRKLAQLDFAYKDVSQRVDKLRSEKKENEAPSEGQGEN